MSTNVLRAVTPKAWSLILLMGFGMVAGVIAAIWMSDTATATPSCTIYWTGKTSTAWGTGTNWSLSDGGPSANGVPGNSDYVCMSTSPTRATVVSSISNKTIAGINFAATSTVTPSLEVQGGTFTVNTNTSTINNLTVDSGYLAGSAPLSMTGSPTFNPSGNATIDGTGSKIVPAGSTLEVSNSLNVGSTSSPAVTGRLQIDGTLHLDESATLSLASASSAPGVLVNNGTMQMDDGSTVQSTGGGAAVGQFTNTGTLTTGSGQSSVDISSQFTNAGSVSVASGSLCLDSGNVGSTTDSGTVALSSGTTLVLGGGSRSVSAGSVTGAGTLQVDGASVSFASGVTLSSLDVESGTVTGSPTVGRALLNGGTLSGSGTLTVASGGTVSLCGPTIGAGYRLLNQGVMSTNTTNCFYTTVSNGGVIENAGTWTVTGNGAYLLNSDGKASDSVTNDAGATLTVSLSSTSATWEVSPAFTNAGSVSVASGSLFLDSGNVGSTTDSGTVALSSGTTLVLGGGSRSVSAGSVTGAGTLQVDGASVSFASGVTLSSLDVESGTVTGSPTVGRALLNGGTLSGSGTLTVASGGTVSLCGPTIGAGYRLLNQGVMSTNTTNCFYTTVSNGGVIENAGTWTVTGNGAYLLNSDGKASDSVTNDAGATLTVSLSSTSATWEVSPAFTNAGSVSVASGSLFLDSGNVGSTTDSGTVALSSGTTLVLGGGSRSVSAGSVTGAGTLQVDGASVSFASGVTLSSLDVESGTVTGSPTVGRALLNGGTLSGSGTLTVASGGTVSLCGPTIGAGYRLLNQGVMSTNTTNCFYTTVSNGGVIENAGTWTVTGNGAYLLNSDGKASDSVTNDAGATLTVSLSPASSTWEVSPAFTNNGTLAAAKGKVQLDTLTNLTPGGTLNGGSYVVAGGTIVLPNSIVKNGGSLTLGTTGTFSPALTSITSSSGTLAIGQSVTASGSLTNSGSVTVSGSGVTYRVNSFTQTAGATSVGAGASLKSGASGTAAVTVSGGTLGGTGTVLGAVAGAGTFVPGTSAAGTLTVTGSFAPTSAATTSVTVGPGSASTKLAASGTAALAGTLAINGADTAPAVGTTYTVLTAAGVSGTFSSVTGQQIGSTGTYYSVRYTSTSVVVTVTPLPSVSVGPASVPEGNSGTSPLVLPVTLSSPAELPVTVNYTTSDASATAGTDYTATTGSLTIPVGSSSAFVSVPVIGDTTYEHDETFTLTLSAPTNAIIGTATASGTITNDDATPVVSVGAASGTVNGAGPSSVTVPVTVSGNATALPLSVNYATSDGTAVAGTDYAATSGTLTVPAGTTTASITVPLLAQSTYKPSTSFTLALSSPTDATIGTATATATIVNTDPVVTSVSPATLSDTTPTAVTITGSNFAAGATVGTSGGDVAVSNVSVVDTNHITATLQAAPGAPAGPRDVGVTQTGSTSTCSGCVTVVPLSVSSITPNTLGQGGSTTVTVSGTSFQSGAKLSIGTSGITVTTTSVSSTSLTATVKASGTAAVGAKNVVVTNPNGRTATCSACFTVSSAPTLTQVSPAVLGDGASQTVTVTGTNFIAGAKVTTSSGSVTVSSVSVVSSTQLTATFAISSSASAGAKTVTVTNVDGGVGSCASCFSVAAGPKITSVSPGKELAGATKTVTVKGSNFQSGVTVSIPNATVSISSATSTKITASVTVAGDAPGGSTNVVVTNPDFGTATCATCFTVTLPPKVTQMSPAVLGDGATQTVTLTGTNFVAGAKVTTSSGSVTVSAVSVVSPTQITATLAVASTVSAGAKTVTVTNTDGGVGSCASCFSVVAGPKITSFSPTSITRGASVTLTIKGTAFSSDAVVSAPGVVFGTPTSITATKIVVSATVPSGSSAGSVSLTVTNGVAGDYGVATKTGLTIS